MGTVWDHKLTHCMFIICTHVGATLHCALIKMAYVLKVYSIRVFIALQRLRYQDNSPKNLLIQIKIGQLTQILG